MKSKAPLPEITSTTDDALWIESFKKAVKLYQKGVNGDQASIHEACRLWEQIRAQVPGNHLVLAYYGSTLCLLGRDQTDPVERSANVIRGLKLLDQAVASDPENFEIRVIRGSVCVNLPEMYFHRNSAAVEDSKFIIACYEKYPDSIPAEIYLQFLYNLSIAYGALGENEASKSVLEKLRQAAKDPKYQGLKTATGQYGAANFYILLQPLPVILEEGEKLHQSALTGGKPAIQTAIDFFAKAQVFHPDDPLLKAYHADCLSLSGKHSTNTGEMFSSAIKAMKTIDAAVASAPDNVKLRYLRVQHSLRLPELFFARTATAITDLEYLSERIKQEPKLFTRESAEEIRYLLGLSYLHLGLGSEGEEIWQNLEQECGAEVREKIARRRLNNSPPEFNPNLSPTAEPEEFYAQAKRLHDLGVAGNKAAAQIALELWEQALTANPQDPVAKGYYGSSLALSGRDAAGINLMFGNAIKGLNHLNDALRHAPDNWELHLLRAYLSFSLPEAFFHTAQQAIQDFQYLINSYEQNRRSGAVLFPKELYDRIQIDLQQAKQRV